MIWLFFAIRVILTAIIVILSSHFIPGLAIKDPIDVVFFGLILGVINATVRPLIILLTLPITVFTLGIFALFINAFTYWLASEISYGIHITTFWGAFWGGFTIWVTGIIANLFISNRKPVE